MQEPGSLIDVVILWMLGDNNAQTPHDPSLRRRRLLEYLAHSASESEVASELSDILARPYETASSYELALTQTRRLIESEPSVVDGAREYLYNDSTLPAVGLRMVSSSGATALHGDVLQIGEKVAGRDLTVLNYSVSTSPSPMPIARQLPPDLTDFCDRQKQFSTILDHLSMTDHRFIETVPPLCVFGQGGIGKTALIVHLAHSLTDAFPDGQLYVDLRGVLPSPAIPLNILGEFLRALGIEGRRIPSDLHEAMSLYRSTVSGRALLVVLDNAKDEKQVRPLLPSNRESRVIITSRRRLSALEGAVHLRLEVMSDSDSRTLLQQIIGDSRVQDDPRGSKLIVRYAAGLPLAIRICGARLSARPNWHLWKLADLLEDESNRLRHLRVGDLEVEASIQASYNDLPMESQSYLRLLTLIEATQFCMWTAAALFDMSLDATENTLEELVDSQLLAIGGAGPNGMQTYRLHDLVRAFLRSRIEDEESSGVALNAITRVMWVYVFLLKHANRKLEAVDLLEELTVPSDFDVQRYSPESIVLPDASAWLRFERESIISLIAQGINIGALESTWQLARGLTPFLDAHAYWSDWERTHLLALDATMQLNDRRSEALVRRGLARLYEETSRWEESERQIEMAMLYLGNSADVAIYASCLRILADLHRDQGRFADAIEVYEEALQVFRRSSDDYWSAVLLRSLGDAHRDIGQWRQSVVYLESARSAFTALGADRWTAAASRSLGTVYRDRGPYMRALEIFEEALPVFGRVGDRSLEAQTLQGIGDTYRNIGETEQAISALERARLMLTELGDMRRAAVAIRSLADIYRRMSNYDLSASLLVECSAIFDELGDHRWSLYAKRTEGLLMLGMGDLDRAFVIFDECYRSFVELGDERWRANCLRCVGDVYYARGSYEQAKTALLECVDVFKEAEEGRWLGKTYRSLGRVAWALDDEGKAREYYVKALAIFRDIDALADTRVVEEYLGSLPPGAIAE
jgi:tetratricopeptide (TPR) repeat protein